MTSTSPKPYRIGVALSGGGAKGFAHVAGVWEFDSKIICK